MKTMKVTANVARDIAQGLRDAKITDLTAELRESGKGKGKIFVTLEKHDKPVSTKPLDSRIALASVFEELAADIEVNVVYKEFSLTEMDTWYHYTLLKEA